MKKTRTFCFFVLLLILFLGPLNMSGVIIKRSLKERIRQSDLIIVGEVQNIESKWDRRKSHIWTYVTLTVDECIKGSTLLNNIVVVVPGGFIKEEGIIQEIEATPSFGMHEKVLLMLRFMPDLGQYALVNSAYSKFSITSSNYIVGESVFKDEFIKKIKTIMTSEN